jgi:tyrosyl-tRNA synthetase
VDLLADLQERRLVQDSTDLEALRERLRTPTALYYGCDPSADSLHVGNLIGLLVLRRFAESGHEPVALAGGATGMIGDPGGRSEERNLLDHDTLGHNVARIADQLRSISGVELVDNADWTAPMPLLAFLRDVGKHVTVNQMMAKESVKARLDSEHGISFTEFSYQLLQANDYVHLHRTRGVDLQIGGSDQWGNIVAGVDLVRKMTGDHVHAFTWPLILRSDGKKFGKSEEGAIWLAADRTSPYQFFQYWMNVPDADVRRFLLQLTLLTVDECHAIGDAHDEKPETREGQRRLAREVTTIVHGAEATSAAEEASAILFGADPTEAAEETFGLLKDEVSTTNFVPGADLARLLVETPLASSLSDARRSISQGAIYVNGKRAEDGAALSISHLLHQHWVVLRKGKRTYHLLYAANPSEGPPPQR